MIDAFKQPLRPHGDPSCVGAAGASEWRQHGVVAGCLTQERRKLGDSGETPAHINVVDIGNANE